MTSAQEQQLIIEGLRKPPRGESTLKGALVQYEKVYMPSRNWAARTRVDYAIDITDVIGFLGERGQTRPVEVSLNDLEAYLAELDHRGYAGTSRRRKTYAIKSFFSFLEQYGYVDKDAATRLIPPKVEEREPRVLSEREYQALLRACSHEVRDAAVIELLLQTGIRLSELAKLTLDDVELPARISRDPVNTGRVHVTGKGGKTRGIPLNYKACRALRAWLKTRPQVDHGQLFVTKFLTPMSPRAFQYLVKKYLDEAGINGASVHTLRHTFATHHVAKGTDLRTVQEALGHKDLKTTSIYVQLARDVMRREMQEHAL